MKLIVDSDSRIIEYCILGDLDGAIEYTGNIPDDFEAKFKPSFYLLKSDEIVENSNYVAPTDTLPEDIPSSTQKIVMQQAIEMAQMQKILMQQSKDIAELKGANKQ